MNTISNTIMVFIAWVLLTWVPSTRSLIAGAILSVAVGLLMSNILHIRVWHLLDPRRWFWSLVYVPYFLYFCVKGNLEVAHSVIHPDMPLRPGIVKVTTTLKGDLAKTILANTLTLTPGTLVVDVEGQDIYVHWSWIPEKDTERHTHMLVARFEPLLRRIFE